MATYGDTTLTGPWKPRVRIISLRDEELGVLLGLLSAATYFMETFVRFTHSSPASVFSFVLPVEAWWKSPGIWYNSSFISHQSVFCFLLFIRFRNGPVGIAFKRRPVPARSADVACDVFCLCNCRVDIH